MDDHYHVDLAKYTIRVFKNMLQTRVLLPSRASLKDDMDERFRRLEITGITTMKDLIDALNTKPKIERVPQETGVPVAYLTLLNREAKNYRPNPIRIDKFPGIPANYVERLSDVGITHSRHMFQKAKDTQQRAHVSRTTDIPLTILDELIGLSDLSRLYGVGPVFARILYDRGMTSVAVLRTYTAEDVIRLYEDTTQKKADFGVSEMQFSLELAHELEIAIDV